MRFWDYLDEDAKRAQNEGKGFILQGQLNAWLGKNHIKKNIENKTKMASNWQTSWREMILLL